MTFQFYVFVFSATLFFVCLYANFSVNKRTTAQRIAMIREIYILDDWKELAKVCMEDVTYEQHFWALFFRRDVRKLYPAWAVDRLNSLK